jgi:DnaJ family protein C protein 7
MRTAQNGDSELLGLRAKCLFHMGEVESSLKHLQQAVRSDPDNTELRQQYRLIKEIDEHKNKGDEYFKESNFIEAMHAWSHCINLAKGDSPLFLSKLYLNRATALFKQKKHDDAIKDCTKAIYYNHGYVKAYMRRSESYLAIGGPEKIAKGIE